MKKLFQVTLALMLCVSAVFAQEDIAERVDGLQTRVNGVLSKAGIHFSGEFRSQFLNSQVSGEAVDTTVKRSESSEFTSVDFDIVARPNTVLGARAMFRLHQDWRNFFSDVQNPITTRWLSIDGQMGGMLEYHAGDYFKKISPLTLWNHEFELLYEPEIFAAARKFAMSEAFVGDSNRLLQGFDIAFKAEMFPILKEVGADVFGARLATRGTKESMVVSNPANYDKYLIGFNIGSQIITGAGFALSDIYIYDYLASYSGTEDAAKDGDPQATNVIAGRLNADTRTFMDDDMILAGINFEAAYSSDNHFKYDADATAAAKAADPDAHAVYNDTAVTGMAINVGLSLRVALNEENNIKLTADYIMNDSAFRNDAAQTPYFTQRQIMNYENGLSGLGSENPFDAMYRTVFKYVPPQYPGSGQPFYAQPQTKNAYNNVILSPGASDTYVPSVFQVAGNKATADRVGPIVKLDGSFLDEAFTVGARLAMLKTRNETLHKQPYEKSPYHSDEATGEQFPAVFDTVRANIPVADYMTAGGGASVDIAKFLPAVGPSLKIGGSYMMYNSVIGDVKAGKLNTDDDGNALAPPALTLIEHRSESQLLSFEINYNFWSRFSLLFGYQQLGTSIKSDDIGEIRGMSGLSYVEGIVEVTDKGSNSTSKEERVFGFKEVKYTFDNLAFGLGYKVAEGCALTVKLTMLSGKVEPVSGSEADQIEYESDAERVKLLSYKDKYTAMQPEVFLTVKF